ncbi:MAG TPA: glutamate racemase [Rectinemataceae bacterium]
MISAPMEGSIVFLDSGVGGLPYLERSRRLLPGRELHYIADDAGFPYGTKKPSQIEDILLDRTRRLRARLHPRVLVIACNTASQAGLSALRKANPDLEIVGTVPAIKPAAASTKSGRIAVLATERTVADPYLDDLIARYASDVEVIKLPAQPLVSFVERSFLGSTASERRTAVMPYLLPLLEAGVDRIVLACTHFLHLEPDFSSACETAGAWEVEIVDSLEGVANRLHSLCSADSAPLVARATCSSPHSGRFFLTSEGPADPAYTAWAERFGLSGPEAL